MSKELTLRNRRRELIKAIAETYLYFTEKATAKEIANYINERKLFYSCSNAVTGRRIGSILKSSSKDEKMIFKKVGFKDGYAIWGLNE